MQRMHADGPEAVYGMPTSSRISCTVPSSPSRPWSATNATSARAAVEPLDEVRPDVDADDVVAEPLQRVADPRAGAQRDLPLERLPALEHRDAAHRSPPARRRSGTIRAPVVAPAAPLARRARARRRGRLLAGERRVQPDLLVDDLADAPHALAQVVLGDARRS